MNWLFVGVEGFSSGLCRVSLSSSGVCRVGLPRGHLLSLLFQSVRVWASGGGGGGLFLDLINFLSRPKQGKLSFSPLLLLCIVLLKNLVLLLCGRARGGFELPSETKRAPQGDSHQNDPIACRRSGKPSPRPAARPGRLGLPNLPSSPTLPDLGSQAGLAGLAGHSFGIVLGSEG